MLKRTIATAALVAVMAAMSATAALGHPAGAPTGEVTQVEWTLPAGQCKLLPRSLKLTGKGTSRKYTTIGTDGSYTEVVFVNGTARDNRGGKYKFDYSNTFTTQTTVVPYTGLVTDYFSLKGKGAANGLHSAFLANFTLTSEDPLVFSIDPIFATGDPISFPDGTPHCDPL
jgi:hypothetical protein